ncbi:MAG TPA: hypothetical protein VGI66_03685 [Streptosporangiaceae bacterium]|jgi:hypothetical protein
MKPPTPDEREQAIEMLTQLFISKGMDPDLAARGAKHLVDQRIAQQG